MYDATCSAPQLTILGPGCAILAAGVRHSGTSQATPFVSAALAIMRGRFPTYTPAQLVSALTSTGVKVRQPATDTDQGSNMLMGLLLGWHSYNPDLTSSTDRAF